MKEVLENISKRIHLISVELGRLQEDIRLILEVKTVSPFTKADKEMDVPVIDPANL